MNEINETNKTNETTKTTEKNKIYKYIAARLVANKIYSKLLEKGYKETITRKKIKEPCCPLVIETSANPDVIFDIIREVFGDSYKNTDLPTISAESGFRDIIRFTAEYGVIFFYAKE